METDLSPRFSLARTLSSSPLVVLPFPNILTHRRSLCIAYGSPRNFSKSPCASRFQSDDDDSWMPDDYYSSKGRKWWVDDSEFEDDDIDDYLGWDSDWSIIWKIVKSFGWMIPAVAISLLLGTGPNAFVMAMVVPLGQTALTLVFDKVWGSSKSKPRRTRGATKRREPFASASSSSKWKKSKVKEETRTNNGTGTCRNGKKSTRNGYGGWDELGDATDGSRPFQEAAERAPETTTRSSKLSKVRLVRERPLLLRLLFSMFPFMDSWTRFML